MEHPRIYAACVSKITTIELLMITLYKHESIERVLKSPLQLCHQLIWYCDWFIQRGCFKSNLLSVLDVIFKEIVLESKYVATGYPKKGTETGSKQKILVWSRKNRTSSHCESSLIIKSYLFKTLLTAFSLSAHKKTFTTYISHAYLMYCISLLITLLFQRQRDEELNWTLGHWPS